ncbi:MAG: cation-transporting P-type ATPase [Betaproteobacteria bacterium]|nr:cation-transporting P-type ATPase [Betaproteobacteria bacterium]
MSRREHCGCGSGERQRLRDGGKRTIPATDLVRGDIVAAGRRGPGVPDGRTPDAKDLFVNQSMLTGESSPGRKAGRPELPATATDPARRRGQCAVHGLLRGQRGWAGR